MKIIILLALFFSLQSLATTDPQKEWHEHCNMTIHTKVDGWSLGNESKEILIQLPENGLICEYEFFDGHGAPGQSSALSRFDFSSSPLLMSSLSTPYLSYQRYERGKIDKKEMCQQIEELNLIGAANRGVVTGQAVIRRVRKDFSTPKNTDVFFFEQMTVTFPNGSLWYGSQGIELKGKFCSQRPVK